MTDPRDPSVPAGWYPDPFDADSQRWWDGSGWTDNVNSPPKRRSNYEPPAGVAESVPGAGLPSRRALRATDAEPPASAAPPAPITSFSAGPIAGDAPAEDDGWAASLSAWDDLEPTATVPDAVPVFGDAPPISYSQRAIRYRPTHGRTSSIWLIVFLPLIHAVAAVGSLFLFPALLTFDGSPALLTPAAALADLGDWVLLAAAPLGIAFFTFTLVLGFQDRSRLRLLDHDETASPWWIVLSPLAYLIVRSVRVRQSTGRRGSGPLTTFLCLYIAPPIAVTIAIGVTSALDGAIAA